MQMLKLIVSLSSSILYAQSLFAADGSGPPDAILFNGKVFTADVKTHREDFEGRTWPFEGRASGMPPQ
jgi:hypothetical protein